MGYYFQNGWEKIEADKGLDCRKLKVLVGVDFMVYSWKMRNASILIICLLSIFLGGCATRYMHACFVLGGYSDNRLQDDVYQVFFKGNAYTGWERAKDFALLRAAEVALNNGYSYFLVLEENDTTKTYVDTTPIQANTYGSVNVYGHTGIYSATTYYSGGDSYVYHKPRVSLTIRCLKEKSAGDGFVYDAMQIKENLRIKYGMKR